MQLPDDRSLSPPCSSASFHTTRWSVILSARGRNSRAAAQSLEALCRQYWPPLYAFLRHRGYREHDAQDLTQAFFARLLEKDWLAAADPARGRFRSFMLMAMKRFLARERDHSQAQKRGGGTLTIPIDDRIECLLADPKGRSPESLFHRQWAITVLQAVMARLRQEYREASREDDFVRLKECLAAERGTIDYESLGRQLGVRPVSARSKVHRMRSRFREIFRDEVADTVSDPSEVEDEIRELLSALNTM